MSFTDTVKEHRGATIALGSVIATTIAILSYLNSSFASKDALDAQKTQFHAHVQTIDNILNERKITIETVENKLRQEMKQARIEKLLWDKKLLLAKGSSNMTEYDLTVLALIDAEISTLHGR